MKRTNIFLLLLFFIPAVLQANVAPVLAGSFRALNVCYNVEKKIINGKEVMKKDCFRASSTCPVQQAKTYGKYATPKATTDGLRACKRS